MKANISVAYQGIGPPNIREVNAGFAYGHLLEIFPGKSIFIRNIIA